MIQQTFKKRKEDVDKKIYEPKPRSDKKALSTNNFMKKVKYILFSLIMLFAVSGIVSADETSTITYHANGGSFEGGSDLNIITNTYERKYSHTPNISDDNVQNGYYSNNMAFTDVLSFPGAKRVKYTYEYNFGDRYDKMMVWKGAHPDYTVQGNSTSYVSNTGNFSSTSGSSTSPYNYVNDDSITVGFYSDSSNTGRGYYLTATGIFQSGELKMPEYEGKILKHWNTEPDGSGSVYFYNKEFVEEENIELYAIWDDRISVTYDANGSTFSGGNTTNTVVYKKNAFNGITSIIEGNYKKLIIPENKHFYAWNTAQDGSGENITDISTLPNGEITLYAQYKDPYSVIFDANGGRFDDGKTRNIVKYNELSINPIEYKSHPSSYNSDGEVVGRYRNDETVTEIMYIPDTNKIQVNLKYDVNSSESITVWEGSHPDYRYYYNNTDYLFSRYYSSYAPGSEEFVANSSYLTIVLGEDNTPGPEVSKSGYFLKAKGIYDDDKEINMLKTPTKNDGSAIFASWNTKADGTGRTVTSLEELGTDKILYAQYTDSQVIYDANGGTFANGETQNDVWYEFSGGTRRVAVGQEMIPRKPNMTFDYWTTMPDGSGDQYTFDNIEPVGTVYAKYHDEVVLASGTWWRVCDNGALVIGNGAETTLPNNPVDGYDSYAQPWNSYRNRISRIVIEGNVKAGDSVSYLFSNLTADEIENFENLDMSNTTRFTYMFDSANIKNVSFNGTDLSSGTTFNNMFNYANIETVDFNGCDFSSAKYLSGMFDYFRGKNIYFRNLGFPAAQRDTFAYLFRRCSAVNVVFKPTSFGNATSFRYMFAEMNNIEEIDLSGIDVRGITVFEYMFSDDKKLKTVNISGWNVNPDYVYDDSYTQLGYMFFNCSKLEKIIVDDNTNINANGLYSMFKGCTILKDYSFLDKFNVEKADNFYYTFQNSGIESFDSSIWTFCDDKTVKLDSTLSNCKNLISIDYSGIHNIDGLNYKYSSTVSDSNKVMKFILPDDMPKPYYSDGYQYIIPDSCPTTDPYTGKWIRVEDGLTYTKRELAAEYYRQMDENGITDLGGTWIWENSVIELNIDFDANGGQTTESRKTATINNMYVQLPDDTTTFYPRHKLIAWTTEEDGSGLSFSPGEVTLMNLNGFPEGRNPVNSPISNITLYAQWGTSNEVPYQVKHYQQNIDMDGYQLTETEIKTGEIGTIVTPEVKSYSSFVLPEPQSIVLRDGENVVNYYYNRTGYTVVFDGNGATSGTMAAQQMPIDIAKKLDTNTYKKTGSLFTGWNTKADGTGTSYADGQRVTNLGVPNSEVTLYATWIDSAGTELDAQDGSVRVQGKAGQTIVIPEIPAGTKYNVNENDLPAGWSYVSGTNEIGEIEADEVSEVTVLNRYSASGDIRLTAHKRLLNGDVKEGQFTFQLYEGSTLVDTKQNGSIDTNEELVVDGGTEPNKWFGTAPVAFDMISYTLDDVGIHTYTIVETNDAQDGIEYDTHQETVTVEVSDAGGGSLNVTATYDADEALFENTERENKSNLTIVKTVNGYYDNSEFTFTLTLKDASDAVIPDLFQYSVRESGNEIRTGSIRSGNTFTLKASQAIVIKELPEGTKYTVSEEPTANYRLLSSDGTNGVISMDAISEASFENKYIPTGSMQLHAKKELVDGSLAERHFVFELLDDDNNVLQTAVSDDSGNVDFSEMTLTEEDIGQKTFYIRERQEDDRTIIWDTHTCKVTVDIADNGAGRIVATPTYTNAVFRNEQLNEYDITVNKIIQNRFAEYGEPTFIFVLEGTSLKGETIHYEKMITIAENTNVGTFTWEKVPVGNYSLHEVEVSRYHFVSMTGTDNVTPNGKYADIELITSDATVSYTNTFDTYEKENHNSAVVNHVDGN